MSSYKPGNYIVTAQPPSYKPGSPVKKAKGWKGPYPPLPSPMPSFDFDPGKPNQVTVSEAGSAMKPNKAKKSPAETAEDKFNAILQKGVDQAEGILSRDLLQGVLRDRLRTALNDKFGGRVAASKIDKLANDIARGLGYDLQDIRDIPLSIQHVPVTQSVDEDVPHVDEPDDPDFDMPE